MVHIFHNGPSGIIGRGSAVGRGGGWKKLPEFAEHTGTVGELGFGLWGAHLAAWLVAVLPRQWFGTLLCSRFPGTARSY